MWRTGLLTSGFRHRWAGQYHCGGTEGRGHRVSGWWPGSRLGPPRGPPLSGTQLPTRPVGPGFDQQPVVLGHGVHGPQQLRVLGHPGAVGGPVLCSVPRVRRERPGLYSCRDAAKISRDSQWTLASVAKSRPSRKSRALADDVRACAGPFQHFGQRGRPRRFCLLICVTGSVQPDPLQSRRDGALGVCLQGVADVPARIGWNSQGMADMLLEVEILRSRHNDMAEERLTSVRPAVPTAVQSAACAACS